MGLTSRILCRVLELAPLIAIGAMVGGLFAWAVFGPLG